MEREAATTTTPTIEETTHTPSNAVPSLDTAFRTAERAFKMKAGVAPDVSKVLSRSSEGVVPGVPYSLKDTCSRLPGGAYFLPKVLTDAEEILLARQSLCIYPNPNQGHDSNLKQLNTQPTQTGPIMHSKALRWVTLGYFYDWTHKTYDKTKGSKLPSELATIARNKYVSAREAIDDGLPEVEFQCALVNYYNDKSTLMGHVDTYEHPDVLANPLLTISLGRSAVFLLGGLTKDVPPLAVLLQSGDALLLSGEARCAYHGVPCILPNTCPSYLTTPFPTLAAHRVNFSLRQVFPHEGVEGGGGGEGEGEGGGGGGGGEEQREEAEPPLKRTRLD